MLKRRNRLSKKEDIDAVFDKGRFIRGNFISLKVKKTALDNARAGFLVGGKISKKAVDRNKIKRRLSEAISGYIQTAKGVDIIVLVTPDILGKKHKEIEEELNKLLGRI